MKAALDSWTSRIKKKLAARYDHSQLKKMAFSIALSSCLVSGLIMLFPLFASALHSVVGLSYTQINVVVSLSAVGMYLCLPVLGYLADCYGPALLSLILIWAFCPAYFVSAVLVRLVTSMTVTAAGLTELGNSPVAISETYAELNGIGVAVLAASFCFIGLATSSLYFSSLLTCAKIYPDRRALAISLPVTCYGLSSLMGAQVMKLRYFHDHRHDGELHLGRVFAFFAVLYLFMGLLNFVANSIVSLEQEVIFDIPEQEPLLQNDVNPHLSRDSLQPHRSIEPVDHKARYLSFLRDRSAWLLLASLLLNIGPLESFQNNLASIISAIVPNGSVKLSDQVSVLAVLSTAIRLVVGVAAEFLLSEKRQFPISKMWILVTLIVLGIMAQFALLGSVGFSMVAILSGLCYGGLFTIYPTIIASVWGVDLMGSTWGSFMVAPAIGSISFSLLHGKHMDHCKKDVVSSGSCLNGYFAITAVSLFVSLACVSVVWLIWHRRGVRV